MESMVSHNCKNTIVFNAYLIYVIFKTIVNLILDFKRLYTSLS